MKSWTKLLITTSVVAMMALPLTAAAAPQQATATGKVVSSEVKKAETAATKGIITEITHTKYGVYAMLEGKGVQQGNPDEVRLVLSDDVEVKDQYGEEADLYEALENEWTVTATYGPAMTRSIPPQSTAVSITVEIPAADELEAIVSTGIISDVEEYTAKGKDNKDVDYLRVTVAGPNPVILNVSDDTVIVDEQGNELDQDVLTANVRIKATYGPIMTMSLPPMTNPEKIVVLGMTARAEGSVSEIDENSIHVDVKSDKVIGNDVILKVTKDTKIVDVYGQEVKLADLKKGDKVVGYHSLIMTRSLPAQTNAELIVVQTSQFSVQ